MGGAIGVEPAFDAGIRPVEAVDAQRFFARRKAERHRNEKPSFERADFDKLAANARFRLPPDQVPADRSGKTGRHAAHALVTLRKVDVDGWMAARNVKHQILVSFRVETATTILPARAVT